MTDRKAVSASDAWPRPPVYRFTHLVLLGVLVIGLLWSGRRMELDRFAVNTVEALGSVVGLTTDSPVARGFSVLARSMFPPQISTEIPLRDLPELDRDQLPWLAHIRTQEYLDVAIDYDTLTQTISVRREEFLVQPMGYLWTVIRKMAETFEIGLWGTLLAVLLSAPLALASARNYAPHPAVYAAARSFVSLVRSIPELVSALIFVLAYGFGPVAGILALGLHCTGFLAKFYAEDIENAERGAQDALFSLGAGKLRVLRVAVLPQVLPQYVAYTLYILDRNLRMATVVGIVGAGGIGQELKGRWDLFHYSHVATILLVLFGSVLLLDQISARFRSKLIG